MANLIITLKLFVDKKKNRVLFADCDKDFVDVLFSFLTLPMGTIVRILDKKSEIGCLDKLYESVEKLDTKYFETEACRTMLLETRSEAESQCEFLKINIGDQEPRRLYRCPNWECYTKTHRLLSDVTSARCGCGQAMKMRLEWPKRKFDSNVDSVFVKKGLERFFITDDFQVMPISSGTSTLSLLQRFGIENADSIETRTVDVSKEKVLLLLKRMLLSKAPLSEVFLIVPDSTSHDNTPKHYEPVSAFLVKEEADDPKENKVVSLRLIESKSMKKVVLIESKSMKKVVYVEGGKAFTNILFSFLTFPLGSIVKLLNKHSSLGCVDNLYRSVEVLCGLGDDNYIASIECKEMLLSPQLVVHFGCGDQLLKINEKPPKCSATTRCMICYNENKKENPCSHGIRSVQTAHINPKLPIAGTKKGGGFAKGCIKFMVADDLIVSPCSVDAAIDAIKRLKVPISSLVERDITWGEAEVLNLLKACITSPSVFSSVSSSKKPRKAT